MCYFNASDIEKGQGGHMPSKNWTELVVDKKLHGNQFTSYDANIHHKNRIDRSKIRIIPIDYL